MGLIAETPEADTGTGRGKTKRVHSCSFCGKAFSRVEHRTRHERSHTRETPFGCRFCPKSFARKDLLVRHTKTLHAECSQNDAINETTSTSKTGSSNAGFKFHQWVPPQNTRKHSRSDDGAVVVVPGQDEEDLEFLPVEAGDTSGNGETMHRQHRGSYGQEFRPDVSMGMLNEGFDDNDETRIHEQPLAMLHDNIMDATFLGTFPEPDWLNNFDFSATTYSSVFQTAVPLWPTANWSPGSFVQVPEAPKPETKTSTDNLHKTLPTPASSRHSQGTKTESSSLLDRVFSQVVTPTSRDGARTAPRQRSSYVTSASRASILIGLQRYMPLLPGFVLPQYHALNRYITMYFDAGARHQPFIHEPSWKPSDSSLGLLLALCAMGSRYCFEIETSRKLWAAGKTIVTAAMDELELQLHHAKDDDKVHALLENTQAMLLLMIYATWAGEKPFLRQALAFQSGLAAIIREIRPIKPLDLVPSWKQWTRYEAQKRTKFVAFCIMNLQCLAYDLPALILHSELNLDLPVVEEIWRAENEEVLHERLHQDTAGTPSFQQTMRLLLDQNTSTIGEDSGQCTPEQFSYSIFGSYILINGLLQHGSELRRYANSVSDGGSALSAEQCKTFERTLRRWQRGWENHPMASLDPQDALGPLASNSTALLRMAYIRLEMDFSPYAAALRSGDPETLARAMCNEPPAKRSRRSMRAALHAWHALLIPIRIGIDLVAQTQVFLWSIQHFLASVECCLLLAKWLDAVTVTNPSPPLSDEEQWLVKLVQETLQEVGIEISDDQRTLSTSVLKTWAKLFHGNNVWGVLTLIGSGLTRYADLRTATPMSGSVFNV